MIPELVIAEEKHTELIQNLMQFYIYDFSEFVDLDVNLNGLYDPYSGIDLYFSETNQRFAYLIKENNKYIGFALVRIINAADSPHFSIAEFFIMKKYRRSGRGKTIATKIFAMHQGDWEIYQKLKNRPAFLFWKKTIEEFTGGRFSERTEDGKTIQNFNTRHIHH